MLLALEILSADARMLRTKLCLGSGMLDRTTRPVTLSCSAVALQCETMIMGPCGSPPCGDKRHRYAYILALSRDG
jgi:hypothetical protein